MKNIKKFIKKNFTKACKGSISIFLAILMVPFTTLAGSLINAARVNSASGIFDQSMSNSAKSTIADYDKFLKNRFGLLAMNQKGTVEDTQVALNKNYSNFLTENLSSLSNTYLTVNSTAKGVYPLADNNVMLSQILEFSKYSVPTKVVQDILPLDDLAKVIDNAIPQNVKNFLNVGNGILGVADSVTQLGEAINTLKDANGERSTAQTNYDSAYTAFENSINSYISKKAEMERELAKLQEKIDDAKDDSSTAADSSSSLADEISDCQDELDELNEKLEKDKESDDSKKLSDEEKEEIEKKIKKLNDKIKKLKKDKSSADSDKKKADSAKTTAQKNYDNKKTQYENELNTLKDTIVTAKRDYSSKISAYKSKISTESTALGSVQTAVIKTTQSVVSAVETGADAVIDSKKNDLSKQKEDAKTKLEAAKNDENEKLQSHYQQQIENIDNQTTKLKNEATYNEAVKTGANTTLSGEMNNIKDYNKELYTAKAQALDNIKNKVDNYKTNDIKSITKSNYYISTSGLLTAEQIANAEKEVMNSIIKDSVWSLITGIYDFFKSLFSLTTLWDPQLASVIDVDYYDDTYGGLPSTKERDVYKLEYGEKSDAELSAYFKELTGGITSAEMDSMKSMDIITLFKSIMSDLEYVKNKATDWKTYVNLFEIGENLKNIGNKISNIVNNLKLMMETALSIFTESGLAKKLLTTGYMNYMLSDRTTYKGASLTGSFNLRGQKDSLTSTVNKIDSLSGFINALSSVFTGNTAKCFVGAEKEYLIFHSNSEITNQVAAFMVIYAIRLLFNLVVVLTDSEIAAIATAASAPTFGIGGPLVKLLYILLEPLADTVVLVNGGEIPLVKTCAYLTPAGLTKFTGKITKIGLSKETLESNKQALVNTMSGVDNTKYKEMFKDSKDVKEDGILQMKYSHYMLLAMSLYSTETLVKRFTDIVQMEATENIINNGTYEQTKFDLDCSYTYIRAEADFTMNEFISISGNINTKEKIIYRGY